MNYLNRNKLIDFSIYLDSLKSIYAKITGKNEKIQQTLGT